MSIEHTEPVGDSPEYIAEMTARAEGKEPVKAEEAVGTTEAEQLLAGKYKSVEELEKGYQELQKAFSSRQKEESESESTESTPEGDPNVDLPERQPEAEEAQGEDLDSIDFEKYTNSIAENGALTEDDYKELAEKHKLPKAVVDTYVSGLQAEVATRVDAAVKAVGSEEEFNTVRQWAAQSLSEDEFNATQRAIQNAQSAADLSVIYGMLATKYRNANPSEPQLLTGTGNTGPSKAGFRSRAEMSAAINDPRYKKDTAYRNDVEQKIRNSDL